MHPRPQGEYQIVAVPFSVWLVHVCHCGNDNESKVQSVKMYSGRSVSHSRLRNASSMFFKLAILSLGLGAVSLSPPPSPPGLLAAQRSPVPVNEWGKCESHRLRKTDTGGGLAVGRIKYWRRLFSLLVSSIRYRGDMTRENVGLCLIRAT